MPRIKGVGLIPGMNATLSPDGVTREGGALVVTSTRLVSVAVRSTSPFDGRQLWGGRVGFLSRDNARWRTEWTVEASQRESDGLTGRVEVGGKGTVALRGRQLPLRIAASYKTNGFILGAPRRSGMSLSARIGMPQ